MPKEKLKFTELSRDELDKLKDIYVDSRLNCMSNDDMRSFVKITIEDQIKGTVGNQEEKEAWLEMKEYFKDDFQDKILVVRKGNQIEKLTPEEEELEKRKNLLEKRKNEKDSKAEDMW